MFKYTSMIMIIMVVNISAAIKELHIPRIPKIRLKVNAHRMIAITPLEKEAASACNAQSDALR